MFTAMLWKSPRALHNTIFQWVKTIRFVTKLIFGEMSSGLFSIFYLKQTAIYKWKTQICVLLGWNEQKWSHSNISNHHLLKVASAMLGQNINDHIHLCIHKFINSIPTNQRQGVVVVGFSAAFMIVFTGCTKHGREGRAGSVCLRSRFKYQQKWCHPTSPIQPLSKKKWKETWKNCLFLSEAVFVVEGVDSFVNCYQADCGSRVACDGEAECLPRHCGSSWVWNHLQLQQFWGKRKGFLFHHWKSSEAKVIMFLLQIQTRLNWCQLLLTEPIQVSMTSTQTESETTSPRSRW